MSSYRPTNADDAAAAATAADENDLHHIPNSLCPSCSRCNAHTTVLPTNIPYFRQIILLSVECPDCHYRDSQVDFGSIQPKGEMITLMVENDREENTSIMNRQIVKSDSATLIIPEMDLELPPKTQTGVNTIEGMLAKAANNLESMQKERLRMGDVDNFHRCRGVILKLRRILGRHSFTDGDDDSATSESEKEGCDEESQSADCFPFTMIMDDPAGNSFIENPNAPHPDPNMTCQRYNRTPTQDMALGLQPSKVALEAGTIDDSILAHKNTANGPCFDVEEDRVNNTAQSSGGTLTMGSLHKEVMTFPSACPHCHASAETNMYVTNIPHFKEVVIMCLQCEQCGYKSGEIKGAGAIPKCGTRIRLQVRDMQDLAREVVKSDTAGVSVPELDLELEEGGSEGGVYTTVEGLLLKMHDRLRDVHPFGVGDSSIKQHVDNDGEAFSAPRQEHVEYNQFLMKLREMATGQRFPFTLILEDPLSNSFVGPKPDYGTELVLDKNDGHISSHETPFYNNDEGLEIREYERTKEQNESLGLNDIKTAETPTLVH